MPGAVTHLKAAYLFNKRSAQKLSKPQLYLGSICPDSVNVNGHAPKEKRWPAHLRNQNLDVWLNNAKEFYNENKNKIDNSYLIGYIIHIVTDIVWDKSFDKPLFEMLSAEGFIKEQFKSMRWEELYGYERLQTALPWFSDVCKSLKSAQPQNIKTVQAQETAILRDSVMSLQLPIGRLPKHIDDEMMQRFFNEVLNTVAVVLG